MPNVARNANSLAMGKIVHRARYRVGGRCGVARHGYPTPVTGTEVHTKGTGVKVTSTAPTVIVT
jgi:hypothetical protein